MAELEYDFIIIGGGTSGLVVAARLSENPNVQVAIIEAGQDQSDDPRITIPGLWFTTLGTELDWNFSTVNQPGLNGRKLGQPQGRVLGGSSAINGQAFIAPSKAVVDAWGSLGNPSWTWNELAPYYRKFHTLVLPPEENRMHLGLEYIDESVRGTSGPIQAYFATPLDEPLAKAWTETFKNLGFALSGDPSSGVAFGGFNSPATIDAETRERSYSVTAYWKPASARPNIHLISEAIVERILFDGQDGNLKALGVEMFHNGQRKAVIARKDVILAAGAFQSPKLLELSGIGDSELLKSHNITPLIRNPAVGENLQDHLMTGISFEVKDHIKTLDGLRKKDPQVTGAAMSDYKTRKSGPLTLGGINYFSYMPIVPSNGETPLAAELQAHPTALETNGNLGRQQQYTFLTSIIQSADQGSGGIYLSPRGTTYGLSPTAHDYGISSLPGNYITLGLSLLQPFSRGTTHISSSDPHSQPIIDPKYLSNPLDVEVAAKHLHFIETLAGTPPLSSFLKPGGKRNSVEAQGKDAEKAKEYVRKSVLSNWHPVGTCSMMPREMGGVVSERLVVHGTRNLRVVDASVMPIIPRGNIQSSVYMVAERAADIIKEDWGMGDG